MTELEATQLRAYLSACDVGDATMVFDSSSGEAKLVYWDQLPVAVVACA